MNTRYGFNRNHSMKIKYKFRFSVCRLTSYRLKPTYKIEHSSSGDIVNELAKNIKIIARYSPSISKCTYKLCLSTHLTLKLMLRFKSIVIVFEFRTGNRLWNRCAYICTAAIDEMDL